MGIAEAPNLGLWCFNIHDRGAAVLSDEQSIAGVMDFQLKSLYQCGGNLADWDVLVPYDMQGAVGACQAQRWWDGWDWMER